MMRSLVYSSGVRRWCGVDPARQRRQEQGRRTALSRPRNSVAERHVVQGRKSDRAERKDPVANVRSTPGAVDGSRD